MQVRFLPGACIQAWVNANPPLRRPLLASPTFVSEHTIEAQPIPGLANRRDGDRGRLPAFSLVREHPGWATAVALVMFSTLLILWAKTRPGFDPFGWLVWGHQTLHLNLDTNGAPSWKPLPYVFDVPYAVFGKSALWLWMITAVSLGLAGMIFAGRIAYRLTNASPERRYAAICAAMVAGLSVLGIRDYAHYILSDQSDTVIVTLVLASIDCHLSGRSRWAIALGVLAALGRPEVWPFIGIYALWMFRREPPMRLYIVVALAVIPLLWFGIPALTANSFFVAGNLAEHSPRALHTGQLAGVLDRFFDLHFLPVQLAALLAIVLAALRRDRTTLILAAGAAAWVIVEIAFAYHGWPALPRYVFEPAAVLGVLAGVAVGWVLADPPRLSSPRGLAGVLLSLALVGTSIPGAVARVRDERKDLYHERGRTRQIDRLGAVIGRLGGPAKITACGQPVTEVAFQSVLAFELGLNVGHVGYHPQRNIRIGRPIVLFEPVGFGWRIHAVHTSPGKHALCVHMRAATRRG
jgi:hypothetical protein